MIQQIGRKLRQQIHYFSGELCTEFGKVSSLFIEEALFGISSSGSVQLTEIGRALEEKMDLHATHKPLSRNLADKEYGCSGSGCIIFCCDLAGNENKA